MACRSAATAEGVGLNPTARRASSTETSGSAVSSLWLSAAKAWDWAVALAEMAWLRDTSATAPSPRAIAAITAVVANSTRWRRVAARRLAKRNSLCRMVGIGSASGGTLASHSSAAFSSLPAKEKTSVLGLLVPFEGLDQPPSVLLT